MSQSTRKEKKIFTQQKPLKPVTVDPHVQDCFGIEMIPKPMSKVFLFTPAPTSAYIHLPFCVQKCAYCAFPVVVSSSPSAHTSYIDILTREIKAFFSRRSSPPALQTLYLGGGTPSLLHPSLLRRLIDTLRCSVELQHNAELTVEMDPATFTQSTADKFAELGVNRASIGAQSFNDHLLSVCRRIHTAGDIRTAVQVVREAGIRNVSLDLISGLPGQTLASWQNSLQQALLLEPDHISAYDLTLEPGTPFHARYTENKSLLPDETESATMISEAARTLSCAGFEHYEISNYARCTGTEPSPTRSRHNMAYWQNKPFYAFGLGATSLVDGFRFARPRRLGDYHEYVENLERVVGESHIDDHGRLESALYPGTSRQRDHERLEDYLINAFRLLIDGVTMKDLENDFGVTARQRLDYAIRQHMYLQEEGLLEVVFAQGQLQFVRLTEKGAVVENSILSCLLQDSIWRFREEGKSACRPSNTSR